MTGGACTTFGFSVGGSGSVDGAGGSAPLRQSSGLNVFANPQEYGMTQAVLLRPAAEAHPGYKLRLHPRGFILVSGMVSKGHLLISNSFRFAATCLMRLAVEPTSRVADKLQLFSFVQAQQQRAQRHTRTARSGPASHNGVKCLGRFQLEPIGAAVADVAAINAFGDDTFQFTLYSPVRTALFLFPADDRRSGYSRSHAAAAEVTVCVAKAARRAGRSHRNTADRKRSRPPGIRRSTDAGGIADSACALAAFRNHCAHGHRAPQFPHPGWHASR